MATILLHLAVRAKKSTCTPAEWDEYLAYIRSYRARNQPRLAAIESRRQKSAKADPSRRLVRLLRSRLAKAASRGRSASAVRDLGCSIEDLKSHIESQFQPGMTWENRGSGSGEWSLDHIYPLAKADLTDRRQALAVCNWRNLQPLRTEDNMRKGDEVSDAARERFEVLANFLEVL